jgi:DNA-binding NarL/FixJ family response regulator
MQPNIIIADDHSMVRKGVKLLFQHILGYNTNIAEATSCNELMRLVVKKQCTHLLLDVIFSDGTSLEVIPNIRQLIPDLKIMIFSMQLPEVYADAFKQYDIHYYLPKSLSEDDTITCLRRFLNNEPPMQILQPEFFSKKNPFATLSPRELEVLHYQLNGHPTKDIADLLNLSMSTISTLKKRISEKTETENLKQLIELAALYNISF